MLNFLVSDATCSFMYQVGRNFEILARNLHLYTVKPLPLDTLYMYLWKLEVFGIQMKKYPFLVSIGRSKNLPLFREKFRFLA